MDKLDIPVTVFQNLNQPIAQISVRDFLKDVKTNNDRLIQSVRKHFKDGMKSEAEFLRKGLRAVTFSATFNTGQKAHLITQYNKLIILCFDDLRSKLEQVKKKVEGSPYTMACFISSEGNGLKVLVHADSTFETHSQFYEEIAHHYQKITNAKWNEQYKNVESLCFYSYDPRVYINESCQTFYTRSRNVEDMFKLSETASNSSFETISTINPELMNSQSKVMQQLNKLSVTIKQKEETMNSDAFDKVVALTEGKVAYAEENRNNFIFLLVTNCIRHGLLQEDVIFLTLKRFPDLHSKEITEIVSSVYNSHFPERGTGNQNLKAQNEELKYEEEDSELQDMPYLPEEAIDLLPGILKEPADVIAAKSGRERDIFLVGAMGILSGCLPGIEGVYDESTVFPNIFTFVVAPASTGKSALKYARELGMKYHNQLKEKNVIAMQRYKLELENYKEQIKCNNGKSPSLEPPLEPPFELLYIPANTSASRMIQHIKDCNEGGIVCETEADSMANALKADWGGFSDLLRKAFHHESVSLSRKKDNEYIEIQKPRLSIALAGTPDQVTSLIKSSEDGLFSRFGFYIFGSDERWRKVRPNSRKTNFKSLFERVSFKVLNLIEFCEQNPATICLSDQQWDLLDASGERWLKETCSVHGKDTGSIIKRHGLILFRLCMIFTAIDRFETQDRSGVAYCKDEHFKAALLIVNILKEHSLEVYHKLPKNTVNSTGSPKSSTFYNLLPLEVEFTRKEAVVLARSIKLSPRTTDNYLQKFIENGKLQQFEYGKYIRAKQL